MNVKQFYRYVFVFLLSVFVFTGCGNSNSGGEFDLKDTTSPIITLKGDNPYILKLGTSYQEQGYSSNEQGQVKVKSKVDNSKEGEYVITYSTSDSSGNYSEINRTVEVIKFEEVGQKFILSETNLPDELKGKLELYGTIEDSNGENGTAESLTDVVAHKKLTYKDIDSNEAEKSVIVYRSFNIGEWKGKINEETTLLARMFINPNLIEIPNTKKLEYIQFIKTEYSDKYKEALRLQSLSISSSFFTPHYYDIVSSLQNIILSKYLVEQPKQSKRISGSVFNKYDLKDKSFTNMALMQIKAAGDDIEFANYADVYYGVRVKKYNNKTKDFDYPMFTTQSLFMVDPVKGGAVGGLYDWAANQFDITYKPTTKIKYNELFDVTNDIIGQHKALIELYKWQGGYPTLLNGGRGISLLVKTVASGAAGEKVMNGVKNGLEKIQKSLDNAENIVYDVDAGLSIVEAGLDIFEFFDKDLEDTIKPYRDSYSRAKKVVTDAYGILKIKPYSPNVKDFGELKQLKQLLGGVIAVVPSNSKNSATREILQNKIDNISDKQVEFKVIGTALFLNKIIEPLIKSSAEGRQAIKDFNTKYENTISFSQVAYYMGLRIKGKIKEREIGGKIHQAIAEYSRTFISKKVFKSVKTTLSKYMNAKAQIPKAISFMKKIVTGGTKFIKDPLKAMVSIGTFLIEAEIVNLKAIGGDAILSVIAKANPAGAAVKGTQVVNDWSSYLAGNVAVANKQYFQVDFDNGKVDIHLPPVQFSGVHTNGEIRPIKTVQNYFVGENRFLVAIDEKSTSIKHKPRFDMFFTERNKDGVFIDGDFEDLLENNSAYKNKTIFKFDLNIDKSNDNTEDENSFTIATDGVKNIEIKSENIVSADLISGKNNISYLDIMEAWEEKVGTVSVSDIKRGVYKESVTVEMMPSTDPSFIIDGDLKQGSTSYYAYKVADKTLIKNLLELSIEENNAKEKVISIKNNAKFTICYEVNFDYETGILNDIPKRKDGNCIAPRKIFVDKLNLYEDDKGNFNDIEFYFYDELARKFFDKEKFDAPYLYNYEKEKKKFPSNIIAYKIDIDKIKNDTLPAQIDQDNINILVTDTTISLSWINLVDVTSYQVCMSKNPISDGNKCEENGGVLLDDIDSQLASINITENLEDDTMYYFRVAGVKEGINGLWSDEVSIKFEGKNIPEDAKEINLCANQTAYLENKYTLGMSLNTQTITGSVFEKSEDFTGAAFCGEFAGSTSSIDVLNKLKNAFSDATNIVTKNNNDGSVKVQYEMIGENIQAYSLLKNILEEAGVSDFSNYVDFSTFTAISDVYIDLYIKYVNSSTVYVILAVTDKSVDNTDDLNALVADSSIAETQTIKQSKTDEFTYTANTLKTDILFVMDDSGSMSNEQSSAAQAIVDTFGPAMSSKGIDWKATVVGTENYRDYSSHVQNFVENDINALSSKLTNIGLNGGDEVGLKIAYTYLSNGSIVIRPNSKLSIVYVSDEIEHTRLSDLGVNNINDSYFVVNNIKVNVIITENEYDRNSDLAYNMANATGGEVANLRNYTTGYNAMMQKIADDSAGSASEIVLSETPIVATISVIINGIAIDSSKWNYNSANKSVVFVASATPSVGDEIKVTYNY